MATPITKSQVAEVRATFEEQMKQVAAFQLSFQQQIQEIFQSFHGEMVDSEPVKKCIDVCMGNYDILKALEATQQQLLKQLESLWSGDNKEGKSSDPSAKTANTSPPDTTAKSAPPPPTGPRLIQAKTMDRKGTRQLGSSVLTASKGKGVVGDFQANVNTLVQGLHRLFRHDQTLQNPSDEKLALAAFEEYFAELTKEDPVEMPEDLSIPQMKDFLRRLTEEDLRTQQQKQKQPIQDDNQRVRALDSEKLVDHLLEDTFILTKAFQARLAVQSYRKDALSHVLGPRPKDAKNKTSNPIASHTTFKERLINLRQGKPEERRKVHQGVFDGLMGKAKEALDKQGGVQAWINKIIEKGPAPELNSKERFNLLQEQVFALQNLAMLCVASGKAVVSAEGKGNILVEIIADTENLLRVVGDERKISRLEGYKALLGSSIQDACGLLDDKVPQPKPPSKAEKAFDAVWAGLQLKASSLDQSIQSLIKNHGATIKARFVAFLEKNEECCVEFETKQDKEPFVLGLLDVLKTAVSNENRSVDEMPGLFAKHIALFFKKDDSEPAQHTGDVTNAVRGWLKKHNKLLRQEISLWLGSENSPELSDNMMYAKLVSELKNKANLLVSKAPKDDSNAATERLTRFVDNLGQGEEAVKKVVQHYLSPSKQTRNSTSSSSTPDAKAPNVKELFNEVWGTCQFEGVVKNDLEAIKNAFLTFIQDHDQVKQEFSGKSGQEKRDMVQKWVEQMRTFLDQDRKLLPHQRGSAVDLISFFLTKLPDIFKPTDSGSTTPSNGRGDQSVSQQDPIGTEPRSPKAEAPNVEKLFNEVGDHSTIVSVESDSSSLEEEIILYKVRSSQNGFTPPKAEAPNVEKLFNEVWDTCLFEGVDDDDLKEIKNACWSIITTQGITAFIGSTLQERRDAVQSFIDHNLNKKDSVSSSPEKSDLGRLEKDKSNTPPPQKLAQPEDWFKEAAKNWKPELAGLSTNDVLAIKVACWYDNYSNDILQRVSMRHLNFSLQNIALHVMFEELGKALKRNKFRLSSTKTELEDKVRLLVGSNALSNEALKPLIANMKGEGVSPRRGSRGSLSNLGGVLFESQGPHGARNTRQATEFETGVGPGVQNPVGESTVNLSSL